MNMVEEREAILRLSALLPDSAIVHPLVDWGISRVSRAASTYVVYYIGVQPGPIEALSAGLIVCAPTAMSTGRKPGSGSSSADFTHSSNPLEE